MMKKKIRDQGDFFYITTTDKDKANVVMKKNRVCGILEDLMP